ncbi:hypothetical protein C0557_16020 [Kosakonia sp. MUSA4]|nr:hypothetical protein C0557_16020 [Kosakonia sp. MUSA4]
MTRNGALNMRLVARQHLLHSRKGAAPYRNQSQRAMNAKRSASCHCFITVCTQKITIRISGINEKARYSDDSRLFIK